MDFHNQNTVDRLMLGDVTVRLVHAAAIVCFWIIFSLNYSVSQTVTVIVIGLVLIAQSVLTIRHPHLKFITGAWPTIIAHLIVFGFVSIAYLEPGSAYELIWLTAVIVASFWRGALGFIVGITAVSGIWVANVIASGQSISSAQHLVAYIFTAVVCGAFLTRYNQMLRNEYKSMNNTKQLAVLEGTQLRSLINSMADAVIATDKSGVIQLYNAAAMLLLNTNQGLKDSKLSDLIELKDKDGNEVNIFKQAQTERRIIQRDDLLFTNNRDEDVNLYLDLAPIRTAHDNEIDGYIFLLRDITAQKSIEEQRDDFISVISHELRTPIAIAEANLSTALLDSVKDADKKQSMIEQAHQNVTYLAQLVNDITTLAHAERGDLDEEKIELNIIDFLKNVGENYRSQIEDKDLELDYEFDENLPELAIHAQRLKEIMQDYLTNAIRYTDDGSITIIAHELSPSLIRIGVKDTGIGLSKSDQSRVFDKFYRSEDYRTRQHKGTGLGLYIAKKLSELIDVEIGVESKLNQGALFYIDISSS